MRTAIRPGAPTGIRGWTRRFWPLVAGVVGVSGPVAVRIGWQPGPTRALVLVLAGWAVVLRVSDGRPLIAATALPGWVAVSLAVSVPDLGRAPVLVGLGGIVAAGLGLHWWPLRTDRDAPPSLVVLASVVLLEVVWWRQVGNRVAVAALVVSIAVGLLVRTGRMPAVVEAAERRVWAAADRALAVLARWSRSVAGWLARVATVGGRRAASAARGSSRVVASAAVSTFARLGAGRRGVARWLSSAGQAVRRFLVRHPRLDEPAIGVVFGLVMSVYFLRLAENPATTAPRLVGYNDFPAHIRVARDIPYSLFHMLMWLLSSVMSETAAATLITSVFAAAIAVGLVRLGRRVSDTSPDLGRGGAVLFAAALLVAESPTTAAIALGWFGLEQGYGPLHIWNSPTETVSIACTLPFLIAVLDLLDGSERGARRWSPGVVAGLSFLCIAAKPTFSMALVPTLPLYLLVTGTWREPGARRIVLWGIPPLLAGLAIQGWVFLRIGPPKYESGLAFEPFEAIRLLGIGRGGPAFFTLMLLFPIAVFLGGRRYFRDPAIRFFLLALAVSVVPLVLFRETGTFATDGNVAKPAQMSFFLLYCLTVRFLGAEIRAGRTGRWSTGVRWRVGIVLGTVYGVAALVGGVAVYLNGTGALVIN